jgi:hypothetical protein
MKYLKTYEEIDNNFKKYIIIIVNKTYSILKINKIYNDNAYDKFEMIQIYHLYKDKLTKIDNNKKHIFSVKYIKPKILFESNDLEECLKILPIIAETIKYNI